MSPLFHSRSASKASCVASVAAAAFEETIVLQIPSGRIIDDEPRKSLSDLEHGVTAAVAAAVAIEGSLIVASASTLNYPNQSDMQRKWEERRGFILIYKHSVLYTKLEPILTM